MSRRLVAALACRAQGSRLYAKPLQNLDVERGVTILAHIVGLLRTVTAIDEIVLGISEGTANVPFIEFAAANGLRNIVGDQKDVLRRLVQCGEAAGATDVFRITTESPFCHFEPIGEAWERHTLHGNDVTVIDGVPEGTHFEIYTLQALRDSHDRGDSRHRSEYCSLYIREHRSDFRVEVVPVDSKLERPELRLTVDHPEDLVVCRRVYQALEACAPRVPLAAVVDFLDANPCLVALAAPYVTPKRIW